MDKEERDHRNLTVPCPRHRQGGQLAGRHPLGAMSFRCGCCVGTCEICDPTLRPSPGEQEDKRQTEEESAEPYALVVERPNVQDCVQGQSSGCSTQVGDIRSGQQSLELTFCPTPLKPTDECDDLKIILHLLQQQKQV